MRRDRYLPDLALYKRYIRMRWSQDWLKWICLAIAGGYIAGLVLWSILDPYGFQEVEGLLYLPCLFVLALMLIAIAWITSEK